MAKLVIVRSHSGVPAPYTDREGSVGFVYICMKTLLITEDCTGTEYYKKEKPFLPIELIARIRALLRRSHAQEDEPETEQTLSFGQLVLYLDKRTATLDGERFPLTPNEFDFLAYLIKKNGAAASREELINNLWKVDWQEDTRVADDLVKRLRRKLHVRNASIQIKTVWGYGFRLSMGEQK